MGKRRQPNGELIVDGHMKGKRLTGMRETAFGIKARTAVHNAMRHSEDMRNDDALQDAAAAKRLRKQQRRIK